jgi:hypothetical protein
VRAGRVTSTPGCAKWSNESPIHAGLGPRLIILIRKPQSVGLVWPHFLIYVNLILPPLRYA